MPLLSKMPFKKRLQKVFWVYLTNKFVVTSSDDFKVPEPAVECELLPITPDNYFRVRVFRHESRVQEYREKLTNREKGFFAARRGMLVASIWATINNTNAPMLARSYITLLPNEAPVHDVVTGEEFQGMGIGPFMAGRMCVALLGESGAKRTIIDVNLRNDRSLRMMAKAGLHVNHKALSISSFGKLVSQRHLRIDH
jgi:RimJ/RimL family protein N-acetyltransferase